MTVCSDIQVEPLPGSAKRGSVFVLFEWPAGWSRDILDGDTFSQDLTSRIKATLKQAGKGTELQLIRRPGREGRDVGQLHRCYLVWAEQETMELVLLRGPEDIPALDLSGPGKNGGEVITQPLLLVCTHGKRDVCCALKGRPLAAELNDHFGNSLVWESSHMKGHRFAAVSLLMPWAYSFGRLNAEAGKQLVNAALTGQYFFPGNRGNGKLAPGEQVAELAVAQQLIDAGEDLHYGALSVVDADPKGQEHRPVAVTHEDGRTWHVELKKKEVSGVISSCGDKPKTSSVWVASEIKSPQLR
ncbi:sucrase ferredoxin [Corynebacterium ammoniagenes]|uniref:Sucrase ferredoxin n=2 Tax=Corynebacterium ammoniagenes TaxID=1697 RepID=A0AAV5G6I8_CORAM|nr:sucrase ferredoxin [Corynebacterium ammoniagenes]APT81925.1 sucrase ferredoxin [Corynebacterium ammoniagenes DSM 20306]AQS73042.1 sucrase ferredoxin [Corynebacterium ammoniagenes]EFG80548.1 Sucrase/ferredoxin-like protein [Corynebacterium ammoniagenes DSM 20306]GJN41730.1 sucrase ferredoxin [Corynebacterium ammoniagenes]